MLKLTYIKSPNNLIILIFKNNKHGFKFKKIKKELLLNYSIENVGDFFDNYAKITEAFYSFGFDLIKIFHLKY